MVAPRVKFSSQASPEMLSTLREIACSEGRHFHAVLEDAMSGYIEARKQGKVRPEVKAHHRASVERKRRLHELLAR